MSKVAFLYPGQGSQKIGMGGDLQTRRPDLFAKYLDRCNDAVGLPVAQYCIEGPSASLNQTSVAQPALFAHSLALTEYARELGIQADFIAGHSLGEYTAATSAGVLSFEDGLHLVAMRGKLSLMVQSESPGAMLAITGLAEEEIHDLCASIDSTDALVLANQNSYTQFVVSGTQDAIGRIFDKLSVLPQKIMFTRLAVGGAFHSPLMRPMQTALTDVMNSLKWNDPQVPVVANTSGQLLSRQEEVHQSLISQICAPVYWRDCINTLLEAGCSTFIELGSGNVLTKLVRSITNKVAAQQLFIASADTMQKVETIAFSRTNLLTQLA